MMAQMPVCYLMTGLLGGALAAAWSVWTGHSALFSLMAASLCGSVCLLAQAVFVARNRADETRD